MLERLTSSQLLNVDQQLTSLSHCYDLLLLYSVSHKTAEDETREKELLKKLVEIVEEKSDIVENLNKDTSW